MEELDIMIGMGKHKIILLPFPFLFYLSSPGSIEVHSTGNAYDNAGCSNELRNQ